MGAVHFMCFSLPFLLQMDSSGSIHRVFIGYSYVSVMYRLCIGYVSVMYRLPIGAYSAQVGYLKSIIFNFNENFLHISQIFTTFADYFGHC
jgi:hypothetical protein